MSLDMKYLTDEFHLKDLRVVLYEKVDVTTMDVVPVAEKFHELDVAHEDEAFQKQSDEEVNKLQLDNNSSTSEVAREDEAFRKESDEDKLQFDNNSSTSEVARDDEAFRKQSDEEVNKLQLDNNSSTIGDVFGTTFDDFKFSSLGVDCEIPCFNHRSKTNQKVDTKKSKGSRKQQNRVLRRQMRSDVIKKEKQQKADSSSVGLDGIFDKDCKMANGTVRFEVSIPDLTIDKKRKMLSHDEIEIEKVNKRPKLMWEIMELEYSENDYVTTKIKKKKKRPKQRMMVPYMFNSQLPKRLSPEMEERLAQPLHAINKPSPHRIGMVIHVGKQRPLYEEQLDNLKYFENSEKISIDWARFASSAIQTRSKPTPKVTRILTPVLCKKLVKLMNYYEELGQYDTGIQYGLSLEKTDAAAEKTSNNEKVQKNKNTDNIVKNVVSKLVDAVVASVESSDKNSVKIVSQSAVSRELKRLNASYIEVNDNINRASVKNVDEAVGNDNLAKVEKEYHQLVLKKENELIFKDREKRARRLPLKLGDHVLSQKEDKSRIDAIQQTHSSSVSSETNSSQLSSPYLIDREMKDEDENVNERLIGVEQSSLAQTNTSRDHLVKKRVAVKRSCGVTGVSPKRIKTLFPVRPVKKKKIVEEDCSNIQEIEDTKMPVIIENVMSLKPEEFLSINDSPPNKSISEDDAGSLDDELLHEEVESKFLRVEIDKDFVHLKYDSNPTRITRQELLSAMQMAQRHHSTVFIPIIRDQNGMFDEQVFGVYLRPTTSQIAYIGPYEENEDHKVIFRIEGHVCRKSCLEKNRFGSQAEKHPELESISCDGHLVKKTVKGSWCDGHKIFTKLNQYETRQFQQEPVVLELQGPPKSTSNKDVLKEAEKCDIVKTEQLDGRNKLLEDSPLASMHNVEIKSTNLPSLTAELNKNNIEPLLLQSALNSSSDNDVVVFNEDGNFIKVKAKEFIKALKITDSSSHSARHNLAMQPTNQKLNTADSHPLQSTSSSMIEDFKRTGKLFKVNNEILKNANAFKLTNSGLNSSMFKVAMTSTNQFQPNGEHKSLPLPSLSPLYSRNYGSVSEAPKSVKILPKPLANSIKIKDSDLPTLSIARKPNNPSQRMVLIKKISDNKPLSLQATNGFDHSANLNIAMKSTGLSQPVSEFKKSDGSVNTLNESRKFVKKRIEPLAYSSKLTGSDSSSSTHNSNIKTTSVELNEGVKVLKKPKLEFVKVISVPNSSVKSIPPILQPAPRGYVNHFEQPSKSSSVPNTSVKSMPPVLQPAPKGYVNHFEQPSKSSPSSISVRETPVITYRKSASKKIIVSYGKSILHPSKTISTRTLKEFSKLADSDNADKLPGLKSSTESIATSDQTRPHKNCHIEKGHHSSVGQTIGNSSHLESGNQEKVDNSRVKSSNDNQLLSDENKMRANHSFIGNLKDNDPSEADSQKIVSNWKYNPAYMMSLGLFVDEED